MNAVNARITQAAIMCLVYLALGHPQWPVRVVTNRDEFHDRPSRAAGPWPDHPQMIAGMDLQAGGTWMGGHASGRWALLTNYREVPDNATDMLSRGVLVRDYLIGTESPTEYLEHLQPKANQWAGFNLIVGQDGQACYFGNRMPGSSIIKLQAGTHVLSNHLLDTPWPKTERIRTALNQLPPERWLDTPEEIHAIMQDRTRATDAELPHTGMSLELERMLSSPFITSPDQTYGTRCSTVLLMRQDGSMYYSEVSYDPAGEPNERHDWNLRANSPPISTGHQYEL